ncbi:hypothetical protein BC939DRAFT_454881 [Gamsiella multidivaricata]|uniref:uncharacterized protein n=1 Tax=Gamsiella multidivaricata TaxID=101098 RepID=UPI00221EA0BC|nr:uncharacterized protein BC939DRAFT_454881 [Gamsiella multidivaricata]KAI7821908.1 hypothetical protein BC939DRAFT_454881 [Gamsiella multidivaricata]
MPCLSFVAPNVFIDSMLAVEAQDGRIFLHDSRGRFRETLVQEPVMETSRSGTQRCVLSWAPKPQRLYFANGQKVMTWDSTLRRTAETFEMASRINALAINSEDILLAVGQNSGSVDVVNRATGVSARLETPSSLIMAKLEYSVFSRSILGGIGNDGVLRLWDTGSNGSTTMYHSFTMTHEVPISGMAFSPFNRYLICTAGLDKRYALYDVEKKNVVKNTLTEYGLTSVAFKNDGISMAFGTDQGKVLLYDLRSTSRPISIVDTRVDAPITAVHFQGKQSSSSSSMKRHQTINGHALKRQNSAGSKTSIFSIKDSLVSAPARSPSTAGAEGAVQNATETVGHGATSTSGRPIPIKTATLSHPTLSQFTTGNGSSSYDVREVQSVGVSSKGGIFDLLSSKRNNSGSDSAVAATAVQEKILFKPRRPTAPSSVSTTANSTTITGNGSAASLSSKPVTAGATLPGPSLSASGVRSNGGSGSGKGIGSAPTTPIKEQVNPFGSGTTGSYPNSRTVSPFAFQVMQSRSPSGDDTSTSSSSVNTPPRSPSGPSEQSHQKHHHYQYPSIDDQPSASKSSSSRVSSVKRRKSFGTLMASGGAASVSSTPDAIMMSDEKMELLRGQIVDRVKNVLLDQSVERSPSPPVAAETSQQQQQRGSKSTAPVVQDLWMQVGLEGGEGMNRPASSSMRTQFSFLAQSALPPPLSSSSTAKANTNGNMMAIDPLPSTSISSTSLQSKVLESVVDGCLMEFRAMVRNDLQNMHLEILRQFQIQKIEMETLLKKYTEDLWEENQRLQEENRRLKTNY